VGPIETLWGVIVLVFVIIALVRGYNKELGVTVLLLIVLFLELQFGDMVEARLKSDILPTLIRAFGGDPDRAVEVQNFLLLLIFQGLLIVVIFATYAGRTFSFPGSPPRGIEGTFFNVLVGLVNGYLFTGTLWYYLHKYDYPFLKRWGLFDPTLLTDRAKRMLEYVPPALFHDHPEFLAAFAGILVILSVRK